MRLILVPLRAVELSRPGHLKYRTITDGNDKPHYPHRSFDILEICL